MKETIEKSENNIANLPFKREDSSNKNQNDYKNLCKFNYNLVFDTLRRNRELASMVNGVYNYIPSGATYPYIHIEEQNISSRVESDFITTESVCNVYIYDEGQSSQCTLNIIDTVAAVLRGGIRSRDVGAANNNVDYFFLKTKVMDSQIISEQLEEGCYWQGKVRFMLQCYVGLGD